MTSIYQYSTTAASNSTAGGVDIAEGCSPGNVNNGMRAIMADIANLRDETVGGKLVSGGSANAHTLTTVGTFTDSHLVDGSVLSFVAGFTNTTAATLVINGGSSKKIRKMTPSGEAALSAGDLTANGHYMIRYDASADTAAGCWIMATTPQVNPYFTTIELGAAADTTIARVSAGIISVEGVTVALLGTEDQTLAGGVRVTEKSLGTGSGGGTITPDPGDRPMQTLTNGGAFTLAPGSNIGSYFIAITNNGSAGAITTSGWTKVKGDAFTTTNAHKFICSAVVMTAGSVLTVVALQ